MKQFATKAHNSCNISLIQKYIFIQFKIVVIKLNLLGTFFKHIKLCSANLTKLLNYTQSSVNEIYTLFN